MKKHQKMMGVLVVMVLLAIVGLAYTAAADGRAVQRVDITTRDVALYEEVDPWPGNDAGEIYVRYSTNVAGDVDVTTGTQIVPANSQTYDWYATHYDWDDQPYGANCLRIRIHDEDVGPDDLLYDDCHSLSLGYNLVTSGNNVVRVRTDVTVRNP
jgi:hypothetical protein